MDECLVGGLPTKTMLSFPADLLSFSTPTDPPLLFSSLIQMSVQSTNMTSDFTYCLKNNVHSRLFVALHHLVSGKEQIVFHAEFADVLEKGHSY